jgi:hypothetical protein
MRLSRELWYNVGDTVCIADPHKMLAEGEDLDSGFREWIEANYDQRFHIFKITEDTDNRPDIRPMYYLCTIKNTINESTDPFYHEELKLIRSNSQEWDN